MQLNNPFRMNDWSIKKFIFFVLLIQLCVWGLIVINQSVMQLLIISQLIYFIYIIFIPGIMLLRIFNIHRIGSVETILYSVGLSITTIMIVGLLINLFYPLVGIGHPISLIPLIITYSILTILLLIACYYTDTGVYSNDVISLKSLINSPVLFICLIPLLMIIGVYFFNESGNNIIILFVFLLISIICILIGFDKFIPASLYPLSIYAIALSVLLQHSLISDYLVGWDINWEYHLSNLIMTNSIWDSSISNNTNAMLSIVMLAPIISIITNINLIYIFKAIYPILFALVPLGLYVLFERLTNNKIAFFSSFLFISTYVFYMLTEIARQEIAEFFLILLLLILLSRNIKDRTKSYLLILFSISLITSHYGLSYIFLFTFVITVLLLSIMKLVSHKYSSLLFYTKNININFTIVTIYALFLLIWYIYCTQSSAFTSIITVLYNICTNISSDLLGDVHSQGISLITTSNHSILHDITRYLNIITQILIVIGLLLSILFYKRNIKHYKFNMIYMVMSCLYLLILIISVILPRLAITLNTTRIYQICLIFLSLFCIMGVFNIVTLIKNIFPGYIINYNAVSKIFSIFIVIFFIFNMGIVYEIAKDSPTSVSLNNTIDYPIYNTKEISGAIWLSGISNSNPVYADDNRYQLLMAIGMPFKTIPIYNININKSNYIYLGTYNAINMKYKVDGMSMGINFNNNISIYDSIYDNSGSTILFNM
jgi:uncharacterized membrane protein